MTEIGQDPFVSNLRLEKAKFWETGEYVCKYQDERIQDEDIDVRMCIKVANFIKRKQLKI